MNNSSIHEKAISIMSSAETELDSCFEMLLDFRHNRGDISKILVEFQPKLAEALYSLMQFYQELQREKDAMIGKKAQYTPQEFSAKMSEIASLSKVIRSAINIGKNMGDAYIWFFYRDNRPELDKHFSHPSTGLFVAGIGGRGELEFIKNVPSIDGLFVLYHGITNILRVGDFSLYDPNLGIVGLGELKTKKVDDTLKITANITATVSIKSPGTTDNPSGRTYEESLKDLQKDFPKVKQQLDAQSELLKRKQSEHSAALLSSYEYDLINNLSRSNPITINCDKSLMLVAAWSKYSTLFDVLSTDESADSIPENFLDKARSLFDTDNEYNEYILGELTAQTSLLSIPLLWWDINEQICKDFYFSKVTIESIFNPAKLVEHYVNDGFYVKKYGKLEEIELIKEIDNRRVVVGNFASICYLISNSLMKTEYVYSFSKYVTKSILSGSYPPNSKIDMHIHLNSFNPPSDIEFVNPQ